jgi:hypothetical protein
MSLFKKKKGQLETAMAVSPKADLAIAFDMQRRNKNKKMAKGGKVESFNDNAKASDDYYKSHPTDSINDMMDGVKSAFGMGEDKKTSPTPAPYAEGVMVCSHCEGTGHMAEATNEPEMPDDTIPTFEHKDMIEAIMHKRKMAEGGMVDEDANDEEGTADLPFESAKKENYDDSQLHDSDDNEEGDESLSKDKEDRVSKIRSKMKKGS